jgi:hypothetical protein
MKLSHIIIASVAVSLGFLPLISMGETPAETDKIGVATRPASGQPVLVPEPNVPGPSVPQTPVGPPTTHLDAPCNSLGGECEAGSSKCMCYPVTTHTTAAGSGEKKPCPRCGGPCRRRLPHIVKQCLQFSHWGYADLFEEPPAGAALQAHQKIQVMRAMCLRMALYRYDFYDESTDKAAQLNPHGQRRLRKIARMSQCFGLYPIRIEPDPDRPKLNAARREYVLQQLQHSSFAVPEEWVVVARPGATGLAGEEAVEIHTNMIEHTQSGPERSSQSGGASGIRIGAIETQPD